MKKIITAAFLIALLSGCASTTAHNQSKADLNFTPPGNARIVVFMTPENEPVWGIPISLNGDHIGGCYEGSFVYGDAPAGNAILRTDISGSASCEVGFTVEAGKEYHFILSQRKEHLIAGAIGAGLFGPLGSIAGAAIESSGKKCGGPFGLTFVEAEAAKKELARLAPAKDKEYPTAPPERMDK